jgi:nucleoside-diphosphate-sugar epimerase
MRRFIPLGGIDGNPRTWQARSVKTLVFGGNRYIGLHLLRELVDRGHEVTVVNSHEADIPAEVRRLHADRRSPGALEAVLAGRRDDFDAVFDNTAYVPADVEPMVELFRGRVQHYVFTSSTAVYRRSFVQPVAEDARRHAPDDTDPRKAYGVGKVQIEDLLLAEHARSGFPATVLRVSHTLGPMSPLASRDPVFFARLEAGRPIFVPGEGFPFVHLVHVADVASCMADVLGRPAAAGEAYNVAGREVTSIQGAIEMMARAVGATPRIVNLPFAVARTVSPPVVHWGEALVGGFVLATDKVRDHLGWVPRYGLADGYEQSYAWFAAGGRDRYEFDFGGDEELLARAASG